MAPVAGDRRLSIVRLASCAARTRQAVMRQHAGFRVAVAVTRDPHCTFATSGRFAKVRHTHPHILLRQRNCTKHRWMFSGGGSSLVHSTACRKLRTVHACERNAARVFFQRAVRQLYGVIVAGFNDDPRPVSIEGFANTDIAGSLLSYPVEILPGGIKQRRFTPAICSKVFGVTCDKPALIRRNRPAGRFPILGTYRRVDFV